MLGKVEYYVGLWSEHFRVSSQVLMEEGTKLIDQWKSILKFQANGTASPQAKSGRL